MDDKVKKYLFDMLESIKSIDSYLSGKRIFEDYLKNKMLRRAIEREFEIIGEAMTKTNQLDPDILLSSKKQIIGMRNRVIHGYDRIDHEIVWGTIIRHLPVLQAEIEDLLGC
jgi:uncharacterized protein with HEPN domain